MFWTKEEIDRHVEDNFSNLKDETEKTLKCYEIAQLYYYVGDYESARQFLSRYVEFHKTPKAYKFMGEILEALGQKKAALVQYECAFKLDPREEKLISKVCELLAHPEVGSDNSITKFWVENAYGYLPRKLVLQLKEKILSIERLADNEDNLEMLIKENLASRKVSRPTDVFLHVKLLEHYMKNGKLDEAYKHATDIEATNIYRNSLLWYQTLTELFLKCKNKRQQMWSFWITFISSLERYAALSIKEQTSSVRKTSEAIGAVYNFDYYLFEAKGQSFFNYPLLTESIFEHMWGQLNFHLACLLLQDTQREQFSWSETGHLCAPLLLIAMNVKPIDFTASWTPNLEAPIKNQLQTWYREGSYRCSQAGHVLHDYARGNHEKLLSDIEKFCSGSWRKLVYERIFADKFCDRQKKHSSYFTNNNMMNTSLRFFSHSELRRFDQVAEEVWPYSLHHQVWSAIKTCNSSLYSRIYQPLFHLTTHLFSDLPLSVENLSQTSPDTLSRLDVEAFLNAAALCATALVEEQQRNHTLWNSDRLPTLPADLTNPLCSVEQEKWWHAAYTIYRKEPLDDESRQCLLQGLEVVRCIGNHDLHPLILVHLARIFHYRVNQLKKKNSQSSDIPALESRSEMYWSAAIPLLERLQNNPTINSSYAPLFNYAGIQSNTELTHAIEEGKIMLARKLVRGKLYNEAIESLEALKCPEASFEQGKIYMELEAETHSLPKEMIHARINFLRKARNCFCLTLDRLRRPDTDPKHPLNSEISTHITKVENELKKLDTDTPYNTDRNPNYCDDLSNKSHSSAHDDKHPMVTLPVMPPHQRNQDILDVSRNCDEALPSLERLDAQVRKIAHSVELLEEQNKAVLSKLDELLKISARKENKENAETYSQPLVNQNYYNYARLTRAPNRDLLARIQHLLPPQGYPFSSPFVYPPTADPRALAGYFANNSQAYASPMANGYPPGFYSAASVYPTTSALYGGGLNSISQQNAFQWPNNGASQNIATQQQQKPLSHIRPLSTQLGHDQKSPAKSESELGFDETSASSRVSLPQNVTMTISDTLPTTFPSTEPTYSVTIPYPRYTGHQVSLPQNVTMTISDTLPTTLPSTEPTYSVTIPYPRYTGHQVSPSPAVKQQFHQQKPFEDNERVSRSYQTSMPSTMLTTVNLTPISNTLTMSMPKPFAVQTSKPSLCTMLATENLNTLSGTQLTMSLPSVKSQGLCISNSVGRTVPALKTWSKRSCSPCLNTKSTTAPVKASITTNTTASSFSEVEVFCQRAKLHRYNQSMQKWIERGAGEMKLLYHPEHGTYRLLLRRDPLQNIVCDFLLTSDLKFHELDTPDRTLVWTGLNRAEADSPEVEGLSVTFEMPELSVQFKKAVHQAQRDIAESKTSQVPTYPQD